jgi:hypothetical protein
MTEPDKSETPAPEPLKKHLTKKERSLLTLFRRRAAARRRNDPMKAAMNRARRSLLITVCAAGVATATTLHAANPTTAADFLAQANIAAAANRPGPAILAYERAQWLAPNDKTIAAQLAATRGQAGVAAPASTPLDRATHILSFDALTALASISVVLFSFIVFGTRLIPTTLRQLSRRIAAGSVALAVLAASALGVRWPELHRVVVTASNPAARIAPADNAAPSFELKAGDVVRAEKTYGQFAQVRASDGRTGWVPITDFEKIIPEA